MIFIIITNFTRKAFQDAINNFNNISKAIGGLYTILSIIAKDENELFIKMGIDNIQTLYQNFLELIFNDYGFRKLIKKIKSFDLELDMPLNNISISETNNIQNKENQTNCKNNKQKKI